MTTNLGPTAGLTVASALLVDYVLTVAVSMASAMSNIGSAVPFINAAQGVVRRHRDPDPGVGEPARHPRVGHRVRDPDLRLHDRHVHHARLGSLSDLRARDPLRAESAGFEMHSEHGDILGFAMVFLVARAFSSGCAALTGVEAISNGVPAFRKPKSRNAATTLAAAGRHRGARCSSASSCWPRRPA